MTVAERIKNMRIEKGYTQTQLAKLIGVKDKSTISKIESAGNEVSLKDIKRIADALGVSPKYFLGWDDSMMLEFVNEEAWKKPKDTVDYMILTDDEQILVDSYRQSDEETRKMIRRLLAYNSLMGKGDTE